MKNLLQIALVAAVLSTAFAVQAGGSRGYSSSIFRSPSIRTPSLRSPGYVYRNPYSAFPSVGVRSYTRSTGTFVLPHSRTPANGTLTDNLNYRGYGTIRSPRY